MESSSGSGGGHHQHDVDPMLCSAAMPHAIPPLPTMPNHHIGYHHQHYSSAPLSHNRRRRSSGGSCSSGGGGGGLLQLHNHLHHPIGSGGGKRRGGGGGVGCCGMMDSFEEVVDEVEEEGRESEEVTGWDEEEENGIGGLESDGGGGLAVMHPHPHEHSDHGCSNYATLQPIRPPTSDAMVGDIDSMSNILPSIVDHSGSTTAATKTVGFDGRITPATASGLKAPPAVPNSQVVAGHIGGCASVATRSTTTLSASCKKKNSNQIRKREGGGQETKARKSLQQSTMLMPTMNGCSSRQQHRPVSEEYASLDQIALFEEDEENGGGVEPDDDENQEEETHQGDDNMEGNRGEAAETLPLGDSYRPQQARRGYHNYHNGGGNAAARSAVARSSILVSPPTTTTHASNGYILPTSSLHGGGQQQSASSSSQGNNSPRTASMISIKYEYMDAGGGCIGSSSTQRIASSSNDNLQQRHHHQQQQHLSSFSLNSSSQAESPSPPSSSLVGASSHHTRYTSPTLLGGNAMIGSHSTNPTGSYNIRVVTSSCGGGISPSHHPSSFHSQHPSMMGLKAEFESGEPGSSSDCYISHSDSGCGYSMPGDYHHGEIISSDCGYNVVEQHHPFTSGGSNNGLLTQHHHPHNANNYHSQPQHHAGGGSGYATMLSCSTAAYNIADDLGSEGEYGGNNPLTSSTTAASSTTPLLAFNHDAEELNTRELALRISHELKRYSIPQAIFAQKVLCRSQGTLSDLLRNPKPWGKLKSGRETFRRMAKWLQEPELQRMSALRIAACRRKEEQSYQAHLQSLQLATAASSSSSSSSTIGSNKASTSTTLKQQQSPNNSSSASLENQLPPQLQQSGSSTPSASTSPGGGSGGVGSAGYGGIMAVMAQQQVTPPAATKRPRLVFTDIQRRTLQAIFHETKRPSRELQVTIAQQLGLDPTTVANFFMNARRRGHAGGCGGGSENGGRGNVDALSMSESSKEVSKVAIGESSTNTPTSHKQHHILPALEPILKMLTAERQQTTVAISTSSNSSHRVITYYGGGEETANNNNNNLSSCGGGEGEGEEDDQESPSPLKTTVSSSTFLESAAAAAAGEEGEERDHHRTMPRTRLVETSRRQRRQGLLTSCHSRMDDCIAEVASAGCSSAPLNRSPASSSSSSSRRRHRSAEMKEGRCGREVGEKEIGGVEGRVKDEEEVETEEGEEFEGKERRPLRGTSSPLPSLLTAGRKKRKRLL